MLPCFNFISCLQNICIGNNENIVFKWKCGIFVITSENRKPYWSLVFPPNGKVQLLHLHLKYTC